MYGDTRRGGLLSLDVLLVRYSHTHSHMPYVCTYVPMVGWNGKNGTNCIAKPAVRLAKVAGSSFAGLCNKSVVISIYLSICGGQSVALVCVRQSTKPEIHDDDDDDLNAHTHGQAKSKAEN